MVAGFGGAVAVYWGAPAPPTALRSRHGRCAPAHLAAMARDARTAAHVRTRSSHERSICGAAAAGHAPGDTGRTGRCSLASCLHDSVASCFHRRYALTISRGHRLKGSTLDAMRKALTFTLKARGRVFKDCSGTARWPPCLPASPPLSIPYSGAEWPSRGVRAWCSWSVLCCVTHSLRLVSHTGRAGAPRCTRRSCGPTARTRPTWWPTATRRSSPTMPLPTGSRPARAARTTGMASRCSRPLQSSALEAARGSGMGTGRGKAMDKVEGKILTSCA